MDVLHDIFNFAVQDIAQFVNRVGFDVFILPQSIQLRTIDIMFRVQIVLGYISVLHRLPKSIIPNHCPALEFLPNLSCNNLIMGVLLQYEQCSYNDTKYAVGRYDYGHQYLCKVC